MININQDWSFGAIWNKSLMRLDNKPLVPRDYIWASELGKAPVDVWLRMKGVAPTNPPNARSMRKFEAGNIFEWIVSLILKRSGLLIEAQKRCEYQYPNLLKVTGKGDFIAGGVPDFDRALAELKALDMPEVFIRVVDALKAYFTTAFPNGVSEKPLEIKSVGSYVFESLLKRKRASKNHRMQLFHYIKSCGYDKGDVVYISRDDMRMFEVQVLNDNGEAEKEYEEFIGVVTGYYQTDTQPPLEQEVVFDPDTGKFSANFNVGYSGYLTMLYGYKDQKAFDAKNKPIVASWNRVMTRYGKNLKMTPKNLQIMADIKAAGFDLVAIAQKFEDNAIADEEAESEEEEA